MRNVPWIALTATAGHAIIGLALSFSLRRMYPADWFPVGFMWFSAAGLMLVVTLALAKAFQSENS